MTLFEYSQREEKSDRNVMNRLLLPDRIGRAVNVAAYVFILLGFLLNVLGYGYVMDKGSVRIDTMDAVKFQREVNRSRPR